MKVSDLGIHLLIKESKSCIDLIFTDLPNILIDSGVHPSLNEQCHRQIVYGRLVTNNLAPPFYIW